MTKWLAVTGSRIATSEMLADVRRDVLSFCERDYGLICGGSTGIDTAALAVAFEYSASIRVFLPVRLELFTKALRERAADGKHHMADVEETISLLAQIRATDLAAIVDDTPYTAADAESFHARNRRLLEEADEVYAYALGESRGTLYTVGEARKLGLAVTLREY